MKRWPDGCRDTDSCERHRMCMYHQCVHAGRGAVLGGEIDAAIRALIDIPASEASVSKDSLLTASDPTSCDDAEVMRLWRECGLPEYFLGNGGTNRKLVAFAERVRSEADDPRDAEIERGAIEMSLSDVYSLDDVVHALGIEDSDTTPAEAVEELTAENERLREVVRTMQDDTFFAGCYLNGVTPDLNTQTPDEVEEIEARMESLTNRWRQEGTERAREAARQTLDREPTKP